MNSLAYYCVCQRLEEKTKWINKSKKLIIWAHSIVVIAKHFKVFLSFFLFGKHLPPHERFGHKLKDPLGRTHAKHFNFKKLFMLLCSEGLLPHLSPKLNLGPTPWGYHAPQKPQIREGHGGKIKISKFATLVFRTRIMPFPIHSNWVQNQKSEICDPCFQNTN